SGAAPGPVVFSWGDRYEACGDSVGVDRALRGYSGRHPGAGTSATGGGAQDRVHQLAADSRADARLRRGRIHVQKGVSGLSGRGAEAAAAIRLGRPDVREAVHFPFPEREADKAEGAAAAATAAGAAHQRAPGQEPTAST